jgi:hypothetical protein
MLLIATDHGSSASTIVMPIPRACSPGTQRETQFGRWSTRVLLTLTCAIFLTCSYEYASGAEWSLEKEPQILTVQLGMYPARIEAAASFTFKASNSGELHLYTRQMRNDVPKGTRWGIFEPGRLQLEQQILEYEQKSLAFNEEDRDLQSREKLRSLSKKLDDLYRDQASFVQSVSRTKGPIQLASERRDSYLTTIQREIAEAETEVQRIQGGAALKNNREQSRAQFQRRLLDFEKRRQDSILEMPFPGELTLLLDLKEGQTVYKVLAGQDVATAIDHSQILVWLPVEDPDLRFHDPAALQIRIKSSGHPTIVAEYQRTIQVGTGKLETFYLFEINERSHATARQLIGGNQLAQVWLKLNKPCRRISKFDLIRRHPEAISDKSWNATVSKIWPGATVLQEGLRYLAVTHKSFNTGTPGKNSRNNGSPLDRN